MSAPQAAAITACTACAAVGGAAAGGAFSSGSSVDNENHTHDIPKEDETSKQPKTTPEEEPKWHPLTVETNQDPYNSKIGKDYGHLFVAPFGTTDKPTKQWWAKSYKKFQEDQGKQTDKRNFSEQFSDITTKVTQAFDESGGSVSTALNKVCDSVYKKTKDSDVTIFYTASQTDNKDKLREDLWRYCSPLGKSPKNLADQTTTYGSGKIGNSKKDVLLSAKDQENQELWELKHEEFYGFNGVTDNFFKDLFGNDKATNKANKNSFKDKCKAAYEVQTPGSTNPTEAIVEKYCSLKSMTAN